MSDRHSIYNKQIHNRFSIPVIGVVFLFGLAFVWFAKAEDFCATYTPALWQEGTVVSQQTSFWPPGTRCEYRMPSYLAPRGLDVSVTAPITAIDLLGIAAFSLLAGKVTMKIRHNKIAK